MVAGHEWALEEAYRRHGDAVFAFARRITRNAVLAEDVCQDVFVRLWRAPARFDPDRGTLRSYLLTHAHGRSVDVIRSESSRRIREDKDAVLTPASTPSIDEAVIEMQVAGRVRSALDQLEPSQRRAIELAYFGGHSYREVAELLEQPEGTVKSRIRAGLRRLHEQLASEAP
jgi:RNA polymerase sigma-70 factor (ECF subfamily)